VKLDVDTLATVPTDPPAAGPDLALDPPPAAAPLPGPGCPDVAEADVATVAEGDAAQPAESPITAHIGAAPTIHALFRFDSRTRGRRGCSVMDTDADKSGEDADGGGDASPAAPELPATDGPDVALTSLRENMETTSSVRWECTEPHEPR
jgi:hypothetical protein